MARSQDSGLHLARGFAEIARTLLAEGTLPQTLSRISTLAVETIGGCDHAGISVIEGRRISTRGSNDGVPAQVDAIQYEVDEGPCLDAIQAQPIVWTDDLLTEGHWPRFARRTAEETGVRSMLCFRLFAEEQTLGALNLYSREPAAFDDESREVGSVFAAHAAVAMASAKQLDQIEEALRSRDVIGQAKGILMARQGVTEEEAFEILRRASQRLNVKLREVAHGVVLPGESPQRQGATTAPDGGKRSPIP